MTGLYTLKPEAVATLRADNKAVIFAELAHSFAATYGLDAEEVLERLEERENLGSTGFGRGIAMPHARVPGLARPVTALLRLEEPVEFNAADGLPVDLVFGLLSPENAGASHLHALAAISRLVRNEDMHEALIEAPNDEALYALLTNVADRNAA